MALASAGVHTNHLQLTPERKLCQHLVTYTADRQCIFSAVCSLNCAEVSRNVLIAFQLYHYAERVCDMMEHCGQQFQDLCVVDAVNAFFPQVNSRRSYHSKINGSVALPHVIFSVSFYKLVRRLCWFIHDLSMSVMCITNTMRPFDFLLCCVCSGTNTTSYFRVLGFA